MPATLRAFAPVSPAEWGFLAVSVVIAAVALTTIHRVHARGPVPTYLAALGISWIPVQAIAFLAEGRRMWLPGQHSAVFFWGDSVALPLTAVALCLMRREWVRQNPASLSGPFADSRLWRGVAVVLAVGVSLVYHWTQVVSWETSALHAPSKVWHDVVVYPVFLYFLGSQLPFVWQVRWRSRPRLVVYASAAAFGAVAWVLLGHVYDPAQVHDRRPLLIVASVSHISSPVSLGSPCRDPGCGPD